MTTSSLASNKHAGASRSQIGLFRPMSAPRRRWDSYERLLGPPGYGIGINTSRWVHIPLQNERRYRMIATAARGLPEILGATRIDKAGFHSILELAMLAKADACIEATRMVTTITNTIRTSMGKSRA